MTLTVKVSVGGNYIAEVRNNKGTVVQSIGPNSLREEYVSIDHSAMPISITERVATPLEVQVDQQGKHIAALQKDVAELAGKD